MFVFRSASKLYGLISADSWSDGMESLLSRDSRAAWRA
jgi:hypothetical protein